MKIAISGSSGFIGKHLGAFFSGQGDTVVPLKHAYFKMSSDDVLKDALSGCDVVINLAGATINQRWTKVAKRKIMNSRVQTTRRLVSIVNDMPLKPSLFISISAVGIYPSDGIYNESSSQEGSGFLADVCKKWEEEAQKLSTDIRLVIARLGVVLASDGGALPFMLLPFRFFAGGKIASGKQGFSWIHIEDLMSAMQFVITHKELSGIINFVSPQPVTNRVFTEAAAAALHRPAWCVFPKFVFRLLYGEGEVLATEGQKAFPARLQSAGYAFLYPDIRIALQSLVV
ncbi:TIGR01777 family oxidoreductase [Parabacteroides chinchillae]